MAMAMGVEVEMLDEVKVMEEFREVCFALHFCSLDCQCGS